MRIVVTGVFVLVLMNTLVMRVHAKQTINGMKHEHRSDHNPTHEMRLLTSLYRELNCFRQEIKERDTEQQPSRQRQPWMQVLFPAVHHVPTKKRRHKGKEGEEKRQHAYSMT